MLRIVSAIIGLLALLPVAAVHAQNYPQKPIRIIMPFPAGGASDIISRAIGERFNETHGQPFIVDNRPGANQIVGATEALNAAPDGYTYFWATNTLTSLNPFLFKQLAYDPDTSFEPVSLLYRTREFLIVNAELGVDTLEEFIELAKSKPNSINYGSFGNGTLGHLAGLALGQIAGIELNHVPYKGMAQIMPDLLANRVQAVFTSTFSVVSQIEDGSVKVLALSDDERSPNLPDVPTFKEKGIDLAMPAWLGLFAPKGTSAEQKTFMATEISKIIQDPAFREKYTDKQDLVPVGSTPEEMAAFVKADRARVEPFVKASGVTLD